MAVSTIITVPPPFVSPLSLLARLPATNADHLIGKLQDAGPFQRVSALIELAAQALPDEDSAQAGRLVHTLISVVTQLRAAPPEGLAEAMSRSIDFELSLEERRSLQSRLEALLETAALATTANALELLTQHQRNYQAARVISDVRPVFGPDVDKSPPGAVITEMLQLQTWAPDGETETIYVAMDEADLRELSEVIDRALKKTRSLKQVLTHAQISHFELDKRTG